MALDVKMTTPAEGQLKVTLTGSLDTETTPACEEKVMQYLNESTRKIVLNLSGLDYISSAGIRLVAVLSKKLRANGGSLVAVGLQPQIQKVFDIVKALPNFNVFESMAEADEYFDVMQKKALEQQND